MRRLWGQRPDCEAFVRAGQARQPLRQLALFVRQPVGVGCDTRAVEGRVDEGADRCQLRIAAALEPRPAQELVEPCDHAAGVGEARNRGGAVLFVQAMRTGVPVLQDRMMDRRVRGDRDWSRHAVEIVVPKDADQLEVGVMLMGKGTIWLDDAELRSAAPR
jgi:hypothetical protein